MHIVGSNKSGPILHHSISNGQRMGAKLLIVAVIIGLCQIGSGNEPIWTGDCGWPSAPPYWARGLNRTSEIVALHGRPDLCAQDIPYTHLWFVVLKRFSGFLGSHEFAVATLIRVRERQEASDMAIVSATVCQAFKKRGGTAVFGMYIYDHRGGGNFEVPIDDCYVLNRTRDISQFDIGVVKFRQPVQFNNYTRPVCLPGRNEYVDVPTRGYTLAWSKQESDRCVPANRFCLYLGMNNRQLHEMRVAVSQPIIADGYDDRAVFAGQIMQEGRGWFRQGNYHSAPFLVRGNGLTRYTMTSVQVTEDDQQQDVYALIAPYIQDGSLEGIIMQHSVFWNNG